MSKKPVLWVERQPTMKDLAFDFCYSAMMGAKQMDHKVKTFEHHSEVPGDPYNIVVGSVEMCSGWLEENNYSVPTLPSLEPFKFFLRRHFQIMSVEDVRENLKLKKGPFFVKPATQIKAFTGFVATDLLIFDVWSEGYNGPLIVQDVIDIESEYRVYVNNNKIVGCKHYRGNHLKFPQRKFIENLLEKSKEVINYHSYTIDVGIPDDGSSVLIELNDGWSCGNYGLDPKTYYLFCRDRWLQLTGIRHQMDRQI